MPKVSVIVPIYNVENYLARNLDSIRNQSLKEIEIILINDGSTDNSLNICREYAQIDSRIKLIDKCNEGVSSARNKGLEVATGEYIGFIDSDDWIEEDMFRDMYIKAIQLESDIVMCNYVVDSLNYSNKIALPLKEEVLEGKDIKSKLISRMISDDNLDSNSKTIMGSACRLIVKSEIINKFDIKFPVGIPLMEDLLWCIELLLNVDRVAIDKLYHYHYMTNLESAARKYRKDIHNIQLEVYSMMERLLKEYDEYDELKNRLDMMYVNLCITSMVNEVSKDSNKRLIQKINTINTICRDKKLKSNINRIDIKRYTIRKRIILTCIYYDIGIFIYLYYNLLINSCKNRRNT